MRLLAWILIPLMAASILLLLLNIRERDFYEYGEPVEDPSSFVGRPHQIGEEDTFLTALMPEPFVHVCPTRKDCSHPIELIEASRDLWVIDRDGWYRLFWSGDDVYTFKDLVHLAEAMRNPTADAPAGHVILRFRVEPASHPKGEPHKCGDIPTTYSVHYYLEHSEDPVDPSPGADGLYSGIPMPEKIPALAFLYEGLPHRPSILYYFWRLDGPETRIETTRPCACGKP